MQWPSGWCPPFRIEQLGWGHCVVFLVKTLNSHSARQHTGIYMTTGKFNPGGSPVTE